MNAYHATLKDGVVVTFGNSLGKYGDLHKVLDFCYDTDYHPSGPGFVADFNLVRNGLSQTDLNNTFFMGAMDKATCSFTVTCPGGFDPYAACNPFYYPVLDYSKSSLLAEKEIVPSTDLFTSTRFI